MPQDYRTMTPGSAVAETIQAILQRRREESRQAMLDKLQEESVRSDIGYRQGQLKLQTEAEQRAKAMDLENIMRQRFEALGPGVEITDPEMLGYGQKAGRAVKQPGLIPRTSTSTTIRSEDLGLAEEPIERQPPELAGTPGPDRWVTPGSREYQEQETRKQQLLDYIQNHPELSKNPELAQQLGLVAMGGMQGVSPEAFVPSQVDVPVYGPTGGLVRTDKVSKYARPVQTGFPPIPPAAYLADQQWYVPDPTRPGKFASAWLKPGQTLDKAVIIGPAPEAVTGTGPAGNISSYQAPTADRRIQWLTQARQAFTARGPDRDLAIQTTIAAIPAAFPGLSLPARSALSEIMLSLSTASAAGKQPSITHIPGNLDAAKQRFKLTDKDMQDLIEVFQLYFAAQEQ